MKKLKCRLFKWLTGADLKSFQRDRENAPMHGVPVGELGDTYLFDFLNYAADNTPTIWAGDKQQVESLKIKVKPIDVLNELETIPTPFSLLGIDDKVSVLEDKKQFINQHYVKREVDGLIERLKNRKKYEGNTKIFFEQFQNTTDEKIEKLTDKYELVRKSSELFIPEFPAEAIKIMKDYTTQVKKVCDKKPIFYVIATSDNFKSVDRKRDPILLVQSPFGFFWQILGAWDKEMLLLSEL